MFQAKPIGPLITCIPDELKDIFLKRNQPVPSIIMHKFVTKMYSQDELQEDPKADEDSISKLSRTDPTVSNVLIDYFNAHKEVSKFT